ncbi:MAG: hypothetical protein KGI68_14380 [Alphaproteobacteria bacterium]|nr:hypothetical protein [Alphaproteobacteria bacterium]
MRNAVTGGRNRPGAGAPRGNRNAFKTGVYSTEIRFIMARARMHIEALHLGVERLKYAKAMRDAAAKGVHPAVFAAAAD